MAGKIVVGVNVSAFPQQDPRTVLPRLAAAGVETVELDVNPHWVQPQDPARQVALGKLLSRYRLQPRSLHTPFGPQVDLGALDEDLRQASVRVVSEAARALWELGGKVAVVHPCRPQPPPLRMAAAAAARRSLAELVEATADCPVTLAVENMLPDHACSAASELAAATAGLPARVCYCLDTGHAALTPEGLAIAHALAPRLGWVHLQDNLGQHDDHLRPFSGKLDWSLVARLLVAARYEGPYLFELNAASSSANLEELPVLAARLEGLCREAAAGT